ncbi:MAG: hypothetical protein Q9M12_04425 [Mariprofundus sp.]|nr:hypothetical protein [Mariprofundus sp.]
MQVVQKKIDEFLDAIAQVHGEAYKKAMVVEHKGGSHILVKYPEQEGMLVGLDTLELMTKNLHSKVAEKA